MGSNNVCQFILERINTQDMIFLDKPEHTYTCGRAKDNQIICLSLMVSRRHCIFFHSKNELYVTDLKSSNGLFINGIPQEPFQTTKLHPNDIIGIGCPDTDVIDNAMFAYKLRTVTRSQDLENNHNTSAVLETISNFKDASNNKSDVIIKRKREEKSNDLNILPSKIPKLEDKNCLLDENSLAVPIVIQVPEECKVKDENDIEILHISLNNNTLEQNDKYDNFIENIDSNNRLNVIKHKDADMFETNHTVDNAKQLELSVNCKMEIDEFTNSDNEETLASSNVKNNAKKKENSVITCKNKKQSNKTTFQDIEKPTKSKTCIKSAQNVKNDYIVHNAQSKDTVENNIIKVKTNLEDINYNSKQSSDCCNGISDNLKKTEMSNKTDDTNGFVTEDNKARSSPPLCPNFIFSNDTVIKLEDELQLTDTDEAIIFDASNSSSIEPVSPIRLKKVQQEPKTQFSEVDVVNLSDSEDDIFPCSQLFDIGFGMNTSVKSEIKEEPTEIENERFNILDDADFVISLTDSEDEDNNWLHKLSRSQLLNDDDEIDGKSKDNNVKTEDMAAKITGAEKPIHASDKIVVKTTTKQEKEVNKFTDEEEKGTSSQAVENVIKMCLPSHFIERMEIDSEDYSTNLIDFSSSTTTCSNNSSSSKKLVESPKNYNLFLKQKEIENSIDTASTSITKTTSVKNRKLLDKKVPQIEPPHLPTKRRSSSSSKGQEVCEKSSEKSVKQKLTTKEKKEQQEKLKLEQYLHIKEQKNRKVLHKWAGCLPPSKKKTSNLTREEKKVLADSRKMKLKKLAMEEKRSSLEDNLDKKRIVSKPKAKVTLKTRTDFLLEETISASKPEDTIEKNKAPSGHTKSINTTSGSETSKSAKNKDISKDITTRLQQTLTFKIPKKSNTNKVKSKNTCTEKVVSKDVLQEKKVEKVMDIEKKEAELADKSKMELPVSVQNESSLTQTSSISCQKPKKQVTFSAVIKTVREYEIDESNVLRKITGKDAPIPSEKVAARRPKNVTEFNAKLNEFLLRIFSWNPVWLEEQVHLNTTAPVVRNDEIHVMLTRYRSYEEYYNIIAPLLLLETWYTITKEFHNIEQSYRRPTLMCSVVENSIQRNMVSTNVLLTTLMLEVLATKEDICQQAQPVFGDLVFFEYVRNHEKGQTFHKVFAYVTNVHQTVLTPMTRYNTELKHYVKHPHSLLTYTMITKPLENNIPVNRVQRLRAVTYLRPNLRLVQALQYLPNSPLANLILNPKIEMYQLSTVSEVETLITGDKLNQRQLEAVHKITEAVVQKDAKLCFIQGPPGTGKSKVIVNIVTQILYGNNRYTNNKSSLKMLVCAPSNAAIDEIVRRLLDIRFAIKQEAKIKPFKMVRIGRSETMHPTVKNISVTELAKRDVEKQVSNSNSILPDSVENEKLLLESKMNALKFQLANSRNIDETYKQHIKMKLSDIAAKYDLLKNRKPLNDRNEKENARLQRAAENRILEHADIITCTLSSCYTNQMESVFGTFKRKISVCIVDEATQSCEAETLIPLMLGVNILVLVGDPNQLPATVLSPQAKKLGLDQSIFSRVQNAFDLQPNNPIIMLNTQYRMQPEIAYWPNKFFYGGELKNAVERNDKFPFHAYRILNVNTNQNDDNFSNKDEAEFVANMIYSMLTFSNLDNWESCISYGILTPYNNQKSIILAKINEKISSLSENVKKKLKVEVNTVDGFQGQERDVIIMSCVRSQKIGFLSDRQRLCVALTRAKHSLIMCGNFNIFMKDPMWNSLLSDARSRKVYFNVNAKAEPHEIKAYVIKRAIKK